MAEPAGNQTGTLTAEELLHELEARRGTLTNAEIFALLARLPKRPPPPPGLSSAEIIRELRGPLPEDDPEFQRNFGRR